MLFKSIPRFAVIMSVVLSIGLASSAVPQDMKNMPGMKMGNSNSQKKRTTRRNKPAAKKHNMANMPGMNMPGMKMSSTRRRRHRHKSRRSSSTMKPGTQNMPGMKMPGMKMPGMNMSQANPSPSSSPQKMQMNMPGMQMPSASPNPQASPQQQMQMNMPGMQMPHASPSPGAQSTASSQMNMPGMNMPTPGASPSPGAMQNMPGMDNMQRMGSMNMGPLMVMRGNEMAVRIGDSEANVMDLGQMGSGTSWEPDTSPSYMMDKQAGDWLLMFHYNTILGVNAQGGPRGVKKFESANWFMPMAFHKLGKGTVQLRGMFSFELFTFARGGSPLLFQTGETFKGQPLVDRQHPHDLWMELSAQYTMALGERGTWFTYFGYPGEPALGPVAFMHRTSASENPSATLAHHLQDSTHISFGVLTTGFTYRWFKLEGSIFN